MIIRKAETDDLESICTIHHVAFDKNHFSTLLPDNLLMKFYSYLFSNNKYNYIALDNKNEILGFIVAGHKTGLAIDLFIRENFYSLLFLLLKNPGFLIQKMKYVFKKIFHREQFASMAGLRLLSIAVKKDSEHHGIGTELINHFEKDLIGNGESIYQNAIRFYLKNNFEIEKEEKDAIYFIKKL